MELPTWQKTVSITTPINQELDVEKLSKKFDKLINDTVDTLDYFVDHKIIERPHFEIRIIANETFISMIGIFHYQSKNMLSPQSFR